MKHFFLLLIVITACIACTRKNIPVSNADPVTAGEEHLAQFPGGESAWARFVERNFDAIRFRDAIPDTVPDYTESLKVRFLINQNGRAEKPEYSQGASAAFKQAITDLLKKSPAWQPQIKGDSPVKSWVSYQFTWSFTADYSSILVSRATLPGVPSH